MNLKLFVFLIFIGFAMSMGIAHAYSINGDTAYINDSNAYIAAEPATMYSSGYVFLNITSKVFTGNVNIVFGFNSSAALPKSIDLYNPHKDVTLYNYTCSGGVTGNITAKWYTFNATHFWCWENTTFASNVLIFEHDYSSAIPPTAFWNQTITVPWQNVASAFSSLNLNLDNKNIWYYTTNVPVVAGTNYYARMYLNVLPNKDEKYDFAIYPSSYGTNIAQAVIDGNFYLLDPWYNTNYINSTQILISGVGKDVLNQVVMVTLNSTFPYGSTHKNLSDLLFTDEQNTTSYSYWRDLVNTSGLSYIYVQVPNLSAAVTGTQKLYMYFNNPGIVASPETNTIFTYYSDGTSNASWTLNNGAELTANSSTYPLYDARGSKYSYIFNDSHTGGYDTAHLPLTLGNDIAMDFWVFQPQYNRLVYDAMMFGFQNNGVGDGQNFPFNTFATQSSTAFIGGYYVGNTTYVGVGFSNLTNDGIFRRTREVVNVTGTQINALVNATSSSNSNEVNWKNLKPENGTTESPLNEIRMEGWCQTCVSATWLTQIKVYTATYPFPTVNVSTAYNSLPVGVAILSPTNSSYNTSNITLNYTLSNFVPSACWYILDGVNTSISTCSNITFISPQGNNNLTVYGNDTSGTTFPSSNVSYFVDSIYPLLNVISPTNSSYITTNISLIFTASDANLHTCTRQLNGVNTTIPSCQNQTFLANQGNNNVKVFVNDSLNNINVSSINFFVDSNFPNVTIQSPVATTYGSTSVNLNFTATPGGSGAIDKCWYILDGGANTSLPFCNNVTLTGLSKTSHNITVYANKTIGSQNFSTVLFSIDSTNPQITMQSPNLPPDNTYNTNNISLNYTASDAFLDTCVYQLDGFNTTISPRCANLTMFSLSQGTHTVKVFVNDTVNNTNVTDTRTFFVDTVAPLIDIQSPANGGTYGTLNISLNYTIIHLPPGVLDKCWYILNGGPNVSLPFCSNITFIAVNNSNNITVYANDSANNIGSHSHMFTVDITAPSVVINSPANTTYYGVTSLNLNYTISDQSPVTCSYQISGGGYISIPGCNNITFDSLFAGTFTLDFNATDVFNNSGITEVNFSVFHGLNISATLPNGTLIQNWFYTATNGTNTTSGSGQSSPSLISSAILPQGNVIINVSASGYDNTSFAFVINNTMGIQQHNFIIYPLSTIVFTDQTGISGPVNLSGWNLVIDGVLNVTVTGTSYNASNRIIAGTYTYTASASGYEVNSTNVTVNQNVASYIVLNTTRASIFISAVDEFVRSQNIPFNAQFVAGDTNITQYLITGYRNTQNGFSCLYNGNGSSGSCWVNTWNCPGACGTPDQNAIVYTTQAFDYNYALFHLNYDWDGGLAACSYALDVFVNRTSDGHLVNVYHDGGSNSPGSFNGNIPINDVNGTFPRAANITIQLHESFGQNCHRTVNINTFSLASPYSYVDDNTVAFPTASIINFSSYNAFFRGEQTYAPLYTQQRMYHVSLYPYANYNLVATLLQDSLGYNQQFDVLEPGSNNPVTGALLTLGKWYNNTNIPVAQCISNPAGTCSIFLRAYDPLYSFTSYAPGFPINYTQNVPATMFTGSPNPAYVYMASSSVINFTDVFSGISVSLNPVGGTYQPNITGLPTSCTISAAGNLVFMNYTITKWNDTTQLQDYYNSSVISSPTGGAVAFTIMNNGRFTLNCGYEWVSNVSGSTQTYYNYKSTTIWIYSDFLTNGGDQFGQPFALIIAIVVVIIVAGGISFYNTGYGWLAGSILMAIFSYMGFIPWYWTGLGVFTSLALLILRNAI